MRCATGSRSEEPFDALLTSFESIETVELKCQVGDLPNVLALLLSDDFAKELFREFENVLRREFAGVRECVLTRPGHVVVVAMMKADRLWLEAAKVISPRSSDV